MKPFSIILVLIIIQCSLWAQNDHFIKHGKDIIHLTTYGQGEPVLIINGGPGMHSEGFKPLAKIIGQSNMAIIYDQRGTGKSKMNKVDSNTITMDSMIADIEVIRNYLGIENWTILGHSFGGMLASYYTTKHPNKVTGLVLSSSGGINMKLFSIVNITARLSALQLDSLNYWRTKISEGDSSYHAKFQKGKYLAPAYVYDQSNVPTVAHRLTQANWSVNQLVFKDMRKINFDCTQGLEKFESPVLIIQGKQDIVDYSIAEIAHKVFQNSKIVLLDQCAHYGWLDQPEQYFQEINDFLKKVQEEGSVVKSK
ncbi:MAG: alpha/beta hydrolase [Flavobacteriales bacterium]|nr:alpha/beta hydrolase [Flavobacteriales bacterium]